MSGSASSKKPRLADQQLQSDFRNCLGTRCTDAAITSVLTTVHNESSKCINRSWAKRYADLVSLVCMAHLPRHGGGPPVHFQFSKLRGALQAWCSKSPSFEAHLRATAASSHPAGLSLVMYFDEACPQNVLRVDNTKKAWLFYTAVLEMGSATHLDLAWWPTCVIRTDVMSEISCGVNAVVTFLLQSFQEDMCGIAIGATEPLLIRFERVHLLSDEGAMKQALYTSLACKYFINTA